MTHTRHDTRRGDHARDRRAQLVCAALLAAGWLLMTPNLASAEDASASATKGDDSSIAVGIHAGFGASQPFSELGGWPVFGLEVGYFLPIISPSKPLQVSIAAHYTSPSASGAGNVASLGEAGADYTWNLQERMLIVELPVRWRFGSADSTFRPFAVLGPRAYLLESVLTADGNNGESFGEHRETQTHFGFMAGGGVDWRLGPGALFAGLVLGFSDLNTRITGDANTGNLSLDVGYRLHF